MFRFGLAWRVRANFAQAKGINRQAVEQALKKEENRLFKYITVPMSVPLFSGCSMYLKMNRVLYELLKSNKENSALVVTLKEEAKTNQFNPQNIEQLEQMIGKENVGRNIKDIPPSETHVVCSSSTVDENMAKPGEPPVKVLRSVQDVYLTGSLCNVEGSQNTQTGDTTVILRPIGRFRVNPEGYFNQSNILRLSGQRIEMEPPKGTEQQKKKLLELKQIINKFKAQAKLPGIPDMEKELNSTDLDVLSNILNSTTSVTRDELMKLFQQTSYENRLTLMVEYFNRYYTTIIEKVGKKDPNSYTDEQIRDNLMDISKYIRRLLNTVGPTEYIENVNKLLAERTLPPEIARIVDLELKNIIDMQEGNPEFNKKKQFIQTLLSYPFGIKTTDNYDIKKAKDILDHDHYGMKEVKQRILEFIAVGKLKGSFKSKVLLLHGPPGVGKSSIAHSIAQSLGRSYEKISLGGEYDPQILKGHRKTYIGSYPGKIFDAIKKAKTENPVILLDQVDKIERGISGSLQQVVMELLDPVQNTKFKDDFLDIELDLSNVLFICTANSLDTIFPPLLDRLERIEVSGYTIHEKEQIFRRYLINKSNKDCGLTSNNIPVELTHQGIQYLIDGYCREAGVRSLDQETKRICQKIARRKVQNKPFNRVLGPTEIKQLLGLPKYSNVDMYNRNPPVGVITGLAYTGLGGCALYIEAAKTSLPFDQKEKDKPRVGAMKVTGNLQNVMKESCQLAYSYAKQLLSTEFNNHTLDQNDIHLNFPEIEIGKDGPSAGIAITCALVSLALNIPAQKPIAMTGEIDLSGEVSAIGGVKEKVLGAKREGISNIILPQDNKRDVEKLSDDVKKDVNFKFVKTFREVMQEVFGIGQSS